eukprot:scaffold93688_cov48-Prasinocladus_malaysianus.AAC.1
MDIPKTLRETALIFEGANLTDKVEDLRNAAQEALVIEAELGAQLEALKGVVRDYQFTGQPTDFEALADARIAAIMQASGYDPRNDERMKEFERKVWAVNHSGAMEGDDEDIIMGDEDFPNARCPVTTKS